MVEATAYAPIDPQAVEGMCYSGDPWVTASGFAPIQIFLLQWTLSFHLEVGF